MIARHRLPRAVRACVGALLLGLSFPAVAAPRTLERSPRPSAALYAGIAASGSLP